MCMLIAGGRPLNHPLENSHVTLLCDIACVSQHKVPSADMQLSTVHFHDLPLSTLLDIFNLLDVSSISNLAAASRLWRHQIYNEPLIWKARCLAQGATAPGDYNLPDWLELAKSLHSARHLIGLWKTESSPFGGLCEVQVRPPGLRGCRIVVNQMNGGYRRVPMFQQDFSTAEQGVSIRCLQPGIPREFATNGHPGRLRLSPTGSEFVLACEQGCRQDALELYGRVASQNSDLWPGVAGILAVRNPIREYFQQQTADQAQSLGTLEPCTSQPQVPEVTVRCREAQMIYFLFFHPEIHDLAGTGRSSNAVTFRRFQPTPSSVSLLTGLWKGTYGPHGTEIISINTVSDASATSASAATLEALKITGDMNIPAGKHSFIISQETATEAEAQLTNPSTGMLRLPDRVESDVELTSPAANILRVQKVLRAKGQIADAGFRDPEWIDLDCVVFSPDCFGMFWRRLKNFSLFTRLRL